MPWLPTIVPKRPTTTIANIDRRLQLAAVTAVLVSKPHSVDIGWQRPTIHTATTRAGAHGPVRNGAKKCSGGDCQGMSCNYSSRTSDRSWQIVSGGVPRAPPCTSRVKSNGIVSFLRSLDQNQGDWLDLQVLQAERNVLLQVVGLGTAQART